MNYFDNGVIAINKPYGISSAKSGFYIKKFYKNNKDITIANESKKLKIGHIGSLDPMAEGVLPIMIGKANKLHNYLLDSEKVYNMTIEFGYETDTLDSFGKIIKTSDLPYVSKNNIQKILNDFTGEHIQPPPLYSAVHYKGKRLYKLARSGLEEIDIDLNALSKKITINYIKIDKCEFKTIKNNNIDNNIHQGYLSKLTLIVSCSKGTYMRKLCQDIANYFLKSATMIKLTRLKSAGIELKQCLSLNTLENLTDKDKAYYFLKKHFIPMSELKINLEAIVLSDLKLELLANGKALIFSYTDLIKNNNNCFNDILSKTLNNLDLSNKQCLQKINFEYQANSFNFFVVNKASVIVKNNYKEFCFVADIYLIDKNINQFDKNNNLNLSKLYFLNKIKIITAQKDISTNQEIKKPIIDKIDKTNYKKNIKDSSSNSIYSYQKNNLYYIIKPIKTLNYP